MKRRLVTSALPYVNNIPHLGNLIQVLSADVFARFCRQRGYETLYICGTDEYGTATETRAMQEGVEPKELCDRYYKIHKEIYEWFRIDFDHFGRTSSPIQTRIVQNLFRKVDEAGYITEHHSEQLYCPGDRCFLADRYIHGTCPHCGYSQARGDQCEDCGKLLDPTELREPKCGICGSRPVLRQTSHLYLDLPAITPLIRQWMQKASVEGFWAKNALRMTESWMRDGLRARAITRDLKWGIPVPRPGYEGKVFYVWFDAPAGYISITADHTEDWERWWREPEETELFQFIGKDNIPFHTVVFPATQIASGETWTRLHHMSSTEYLNYEGGKFSKSKNMGVFGNDCRSTGIPADVWRFYIYYNRPETSDYQFGWKDFQDRVNGELIGNFANLVNRTLAFTERFYKGVIPDGPVDEDLWRRVREAGEDITEKLERAELRSALHGIFELSDVGNKAFQAGEPWKAVKDEPEAARRLIRTLCALVQDLAVLIKPYLPETAERVLASFGKGDDAWASLGKADLPRRVKKPEILFRRIEDGEVAALRERFGTGGGGQDGSGARGVAGRNETGTELSPEERFAAVRLVAARVVEVRDHPDARKLYVLNLDDGSGQKRQICSGLVGRYSPQELEGRTIVLVANLKPARLRGVESQGMLLAADDGGDGLEVLFTEAAAGSPVGLKSGSGAVPSLISIDKFSKILVHVRDYQVLVGDSPLFAEGRPLRTVKIARGSVA